MSEFNITVEGGSSVKLPTAGKYCDRDIVVTASGDQDIDTINTLITTIGYTDVFESDVTSIRSYAFYDTAFKTIRLPRLTSIGSRCFYECRELESIYIPNLEGLTGYDFRYCTSLTKIDLPKLKNVSSYSFHSCVGLKAIILRNETLCPLENTNGFAGTPIESGTGYVYVPSKLVDSYKSATNWTAYSNQIRAIEDYPEITLTE